MARIERLPPQVANLIAAGEVVERPASVIKELVENAVDAGSTLITVEIRRGGASLMRVTDNGCGIAPDQAGTAFLRHATSKIRTQEDLFEVKTLGFRGEALAAIAAVSRIELFSRERGASAGVSLSLEGGSVTEQTECGCPEGTTVLVRELFFNTPARQKFLRRDATEAAHVQETVTRAAMAHPEISFRLIKDGAQSLHTPGNGVLLDCLYSVYGSEFARSLLAVESQAVSGFVGKPEAARQSRAMQFFLLNGRPVRSRTLTAALEEAYKNELPAGRVPVCVLHLHLPYDSADVNVHPAKLEVRFTRERDVFDMVYFAVKNALESDSSRPELTLAAPKTAALSFSAPPADAGAPALPGQRAMSVRDPWTAGEPIVWHGLVPPPAPQASVLPGLRSWRYIGEALGGFLLVDDGEALVLIDKHAAHERILFERLKAAQESPMAQMLLSPEAVALSAAECDALLESSGLLSELGFVFELFGPSSLLLRALPDVLEAENPAALLTELAALLLSGRRSATLRDDVLELVACKAAVKLGGGGSDGDLRALCQTVMETPTLRHCPHGRPVAIELTRDRLKRQFGR